VQTQELNRFLEMAVMKVFNNYLNMKNIANISFDFVLLTSLFFASIKFCYQNSTQIYSSTLLLTVLLVVGILVINNMLGFYEQSTRKTYSEIKIRGIFALVFYLLFLFVAMSYFPANLADERKYILALVLSVVIMLIHRMYVLLVINNGFLRQRILVYGSGAQALEVGRKLKKFDSNIDVVGYYAGLKEVEKNDTDFVFLTSGKTLTEHVHEQKVDEIIVALSERRGGSMPLRELLECKLSGVKVADMASHFEKKTGKISRDYVSVGNLVFCDGFKQGIVRSAIKKIFDVVFSLVLLAIAFPILVLASICILIESGWPLIYYQERVGLNGRIFKIYKLRSMRTDAEEKDKPVWALLKDDRITGVGRIIRKFRIDELPQLISVLSGHMSLVGPRPERSFFVQKLIKDLPFYEVRLSVKPGLTGWAQVRYHYASSIEDAAEKLQYDLYYVKNNSIFLDFLILYKTIGVVLAGKGAH